MTKKILMIAGPNGAGKTTTASTLLPEFKKIYEFVNADEIAHAMAPLHPESVALTASKLMIKRLRELFSLNKNFAFETTASGINYLKLLIEAQKKGYKVYLLFIWISSPEQAINRVMGRVAQGGHNIPHETIKRRYYAGLKNLVRHYLPLVDCAMIVDNTLLAKRKLIAIKRDKSDLQIMDLNIWEDIERNAHVGDR